jgi:hypothetical protein
MGLSKDDKWLSAPGLSELQGEVSLHDLQEFWGSSLREPPWGGWRDLSRWDRFDWQSFSEFLDSTHRSADELAKVWIWKKGKETK